MIIIIKPVTKKVFFACLTIFSFPSFTALQQMKHPDRHHSAAMAIYQTSWLETYGTQATTSQMFVKQMRCFVAGWEL